MTIHEAIERHLKVILSSYATLKVYADVAPEKSVIPFVVYSKYSTQYSHILGDDSGYCDGYFQIDIYNSNKKDTLAIAKTIRQSLFNFNGIMGAVAGVGTPPVGAIAGVNIQASLLENETDSFENQTELYRVIQEYKFNYYEEV